MTSAVIPLLVVAALAAPNAPFEPGQEVTYRGTVKQRAEGADQPAGQGKSFELKWFVGEAGGTAKRLYWLVDERGHGAWPWIERVGELTLDAQGQPQGASVPALLYNYGEGESAVPLPSPIAPVEPSLTVGAKWKQGSFDYEVLGEETVDDHPTWRIQMGNNYGVKRTMLVDKGSPLIRSLTERVFMNKGTEYTLEMKLVAIDRRADQQRDMSHASLAGLIALRTQLHRPTPSADIAWTKDEIALIAAALPDLEKSAAGGPLEKLVASAARDIALQDGRAGEVGDLVAKFQGQPLPAVKFAGLTGGELDSADLAGQVTVLHFWEYRDEPLKEPYGQVGYLEFLHQKRKEQGVKVYGVAVDPRLNDEAERRTALAGIRKLRSFMNLSYPLVLDAGAGIKALGDPRIVGATLPLVVVVGRDGRVTHYHVGYYEVDRQEGLKELDAAVTAALKQ